MTTYQRPPSPDPPPSEPAHSTNETALWAGACMFFGNLLGLKVLEVISGDDWAQILGAVIVSLIAAGAVYSKERLTVAREGTEPKRKD